MSLLVLNSDQRTGVCMINTADHAGYEPRIMRIPNEYTGVHCALGDFKFVQ